MNYSYLLLNVRATSVVTNTTQQLLLHEPEGHHCCYIRKKLAQTLKLDPVLTFSVLEVLKPVHLAWTTKQKWDPFSGVRGGFPPQAGAFREHGIHLCTLGSHCSLPSTGKCLEPPFTQNHAEGKRNGRFSLSTCVGYLFTLSSLPQRSALT